MANGMGSLYIGVSGLQSAQTALNTTAHNLSNINSTGYTRQQTSFATATYLPIGSGLSTKQYGLGVKIEDIRRVRNEFVDDAYRSSNGRLGYYKSQYEAVEEVEELFGELQGVTYQESLNNLKEAINELSKNPTSTTARTSVIQQATAFMTRSDTIYQQLNDYQTTLNAQVSNLVDKINSLGDEIKDLNKRILDIEGAGVESANDLRDQRDNALDELSQYINVDYYYTSEGKLVVNAEGTPFVTEGLVNHMSMRISNDRGLLIPTWPAFDNNDVFNEDLSKANNYNNTDSGKLKGIIIARGNGSADYTDVPVKPNAADYDVNTPQGEAAYNSAMKEYQTKQDYYNKYIEPSAILSAMSGLDKLVNGLVEDINNVLCPEKTKTTTDALLDADGNELTAVNYKYNNSTHAVLYNHQGKTIKGVLVSGEGENAVYRYDSAEKLYTDMNGEQAEPVDEYTYAFLDMDKTSYGMDADKTVGCELFSRNETERYIKTTDADGKTIYLRNNINKRGDLSLYTLGNISVNPTASQNIDKIPLVTKDGKEDFSKAQELVDLWNKKFASLNPEDYSITNYGDFYSDFIGEFAMVGQVLDNYTSNQQKMVTGYDDQRLQISGVASDEELEKMIKYQQAYNAASRYINVVDEMTEHLITSLGK